MLTPDKRAVVLLSGGLDSTTVLAMAAADGFAPYAMSFSYGQHQRVELQAAKKIARRFNCVEHRLVTIDLAAFGGSALTDSSIVVPKNRSHDGIAQGGIPLTYVPARNTIFLSYALAWAEVLGAADIFIGANVVDYSGYPDCRPEFMAAFQTMANLGTRAGVDGERPFEVHAPLMHLGKADIITRGLALGIDYSMTHTCYDPVDDLACGHCDACSLRHQGFVQAGVPDPTRYHVPATQLGASL